MNASNEQIKKIESLKSRIYKTQYAILTIVGDDLIQEETKEALNKQWVCFEEEIATLNSQIKSIQEECLHDVENISDERSNWETYKCKKCGKFI